MKSPRGLRLRVLALAPLLATTLLLPLSTATAAAAETPLPAATVIDLTDDSTEALALPDPMDRGTYTPATIQEAKLGLVDLQEPNSAGSAPTAGSAQAAERLEVRGALYYPADRTVPSPVIILVHGNHGSCDSGQNSTTASCAQFKRNEAGYAYLGENLATWGYTTFSVSMDQLMMRQDSAKGKGMHQRRLLIAASLDALSAANQPGGLPVDASTTIGTTLVGKLDMTRIGLMGHSRGGDAVTSFIDYNRQRTDGTRYPLRGVIALAPVDYERKAPYGTPFLSILPWCDGDVSNLQGARFFERGQYINPQDPFPRIQSSQLGANHNWYNTVWFADGQDGGTVQDAACGNNTPTGNNNTQPFNHRLSGAASYNPWSYVIDNSDTYNPLVNTKISGDPARMGDQEKIGLATMSSFFRRYVGGEGAFEPYMTGELSTSADHLQIPSTACPTSESGTRIDCAEYVSTSYFAPTDERVDVIRPEVENPLTLNALGGSLSGSGFAYPYLDNGGVTLPAATPQGFDWCNPEPDDFAPSQLGKTTQPTAAKACPLPGKAELGGQNGTRENSPVNMSYGRQLALAWEAPAALTADIPAASSDLSDLKALALGADVNYFDTRNPNSTRVVDGVVQPVAYDPASVTQDFQIVLTDTAGKEGVVNAGDPKWGNALHYSPGTVTARMHIVLDQIRVPLTEFAAQGVDLTSVDELEFRFGGEGLPASGSIQVADVRFQEKAVTEPLILSDGVALNQGAGYGPPATGPDPAALLAGYDVSAGNLKLINTVGTVGGNSTWVVDNDRVQCPNANFTTIQDAVDHAAPWDTIVICEGVYDESSTPVRGPGNPLVTDATNGLTITKPLKIKGVGADKVTIRPDQSLSTLAGVSPYLRDGGGNVITVSRQSLGSTDTNELFVDISGVTVTSGNVFAEAGIAFFGAAGRVSESVVGPFRTAANATELAEHPHGWGIVKTSLILGAGPGTVDTQVTVANSVVKGYQSGGILFDGARGADGHADNLVRTNTKQHGYVTNTVVTGTPNSVFPQTGIKYTSGTDGFVQASRITNNWFRPDPSKSFGLLLADAKTETAGALVARTSILTGNGFAAANLTADGSAARTDGPLVVQGTFLGAGNPVVGGPADPSTGLEAVSAGVTVQQRATNPVAAVPTGVGAVVDAAPTVTLVDPGAGLEVIPGTTLQPLVKATDDFAVQSVTLLADGAPVATATVSPYRFDWTAAAAQVGTEVALTAVATDSTGRSTTSAPVTVTVVPEVLPTELSVVLDPTATASGQSVRATATVTATATPTGTVVLTSGETVLGSSVVTDGVATINFSTTGLVLGRSTLTATYVPDGSFTPSETSVDLAVNFTDMPGGSLFYDEVLWLAENGISRGNPDGSFSPGTFLSRGAMAAFVYRLANDGATAPACADRPFPDVLVTSQFCGEITWMKATGLTAGYEDGTFRPQANISRQAMAAFLYRLGTDNTPNPVCDSTRFPDVPADSPFCGEITWMAATGLSTGTDGFYKPGDPTSRQAMAAFLSRFAALS